MRRILAGKRIMNWILRSNESHLYPTRPFCSASHNSKPTTTNGGGGNGSSSSPSLSTYSEQLKALENLDFTSAAKILFSEPVKKKKFGFDFHMVQFFFACLPALAVYLLAMYARSERRKMDEELERKKQAELKAQAKEMELKVAEEKAAAESNPALLEVKERLDKLEQTVKEIAVESKKQFHDATKTGGEDNTKQKKADQVDPETTKNETLGKTSKDRTDSNEGNTSGLAPVAHVSQKSQKDNRK